MTPASHPTPPRHPLEHWLKVEETDDGQRLAEPIFQRRYRESAPDFPHHVIAHCRTQDDVWLPACYIHFTALGDVLLGGGACVDDRVLRRLPLEARQSLHQAGGLYQHTLRWSMQHFSTRCRAIFGYCGDVLAERADLAVGFAKTEFPHLLVYYPAPLPQADRDALIAAAHAASPF